MKPTPLLISMLVFLMCGVMCLFSTENVYAQVPQTKRSEIDGWLKGIRSKKKNNDLQKKLDNKGMNSEGSEIKIRLSSGRIEFDKGSASSSTIYFTWGSFGVGQSEFFYGKDYNSDYSFRFKPIIFNEMSYSFGKNNNYTLGFGNIKSGDVGIYISETNEDFRANTIKGNSSFFLYSYNLSFFEILFGYRYIRVEASDFLTFTPSTVSEKYIIEGGHSIFGIGIIF